MDKKKERALEAAKTIEREKRKSEKELDEIMDYTPEKKKGGEMV